MGYACQNLEHKMNFEGAYICDGWVDSTQMVPHLLTQQIFLHENDVSVVTDLVCT